MTALALFEDEYTRIALLATARIAGCLAWLPAFAAGGVTSRRARVLIGLLMTFGFWPAVAGTPLPDSWGVYLGWLAKEALIGTAMGMAVAMPMQVFHAWGALVDNQRGASIGASLDPLSGVEATELAQLFQTFAMMLFLCMGGLDELVSLMRQSFIDLPIGLAVLPDIGDTTSFVGRLLASSLTISAPVIILLLLSECLLGLLSRFAPQMNAFSVSLAIKSLLAFFALTIYVVAAAPGQLERLWRQVHG